MREKSLVIPLGLASHWLPVVPEDPINPANTDMSCRLHQQTFVLGKWYTVIGDINDIIKFIHLNKKTYFQTHQPRRAGRSHHSILALVNRNRQSDALFT